MATRKTTDTKPAPRKAAVRDGLANIVTGSGTSVDRRMHSRWVQTFADPLQIDTAYRSSWLMRRIVDTPADDMTRAWRDWQSVDTDIELLEKEEKRLKLRERVKAAIRLGRLGGGALILGVNQGSVADPLIPEQLGLQSLQYVHAVGKGALDVGPMVDDPESADFGEPEYFDLKRNSGNVRIHRDRIIVFKGMFGGTGISRDAARADYWGDSIVTSCMEAVSNAETAMNEFASLISEAKIDVFAIPDLLAQAGSPEFEARVMRRLELAAVGKSTHRALIMDAAEKWEQRQMNWSGMPEVIKTYLAIVAGASDIPATRLLGKSADGMNATGDGDQGNYDQMIRSRQDNDLRPALEKIDIALVPSALGTPPAELFFEFASLSVLGEVAQAETENKEANTLNILTSTGLFQDDALEEAFSNRMIESGRWPGYEEAREKALAAAKIEPTPADITGVLPPPAVDPLTGLPVVAPPVPAGPPVKPPAGAG